MSAHPVLEKTNPSSVVPVTSKHCFAPTGVATIVPASNLINQVSLSQRNTGSAVNGYRAPVISSQQQIMVPVSN